MRLAADANVLLATLLGGRSRLVFTSPLIGEVLTTETVLAEVEEYAPILAAKRRLNPDSVLLAVSALPVIVIPKSVYKRKVAEAERRMRERDPEDVDLLALALHFRVAVWSNDDDFSAGRVPWFTTSALMTHLGF